MLLYVKFNIDFFKKINYYEMEVYNDNLNAMLKDRAYKPSNLPRSLKIIVSTTLNIEKMDDQGHELNAERSFEILRSEVKHVIIITDKMGKWRPYAEKWYSEGVEVDRIIEIFHIDYFLSNPTEFFLSAQIEKVKDPDVLNEKYGVKNPIEEYPLMSSYDSLIRWYDFKPEDIVKLTRADDSIDYAIVVRTNLSEWGDSLSLYIG